MTGKAHRVDRSPKGLTQLPNERLLDIVFHLRIPDLRRLSQVNRELRFFTEDYLVQYRYNSGLVALPNEIILEIVKYLGSQDDRSHFARTSLRFYPVVMDYIFRYDVRYYSSRMLHYAARRNFQKMTRSIMDIGGDVNTLGGSVLYIFGKRCTPLATAAAHGHMTMVKILLEGGASHFIDGIRLPLAAAMLNRHENIAMVLSRDLDSGDIIGEGVNATVLQMACTEKLVNLVRYYLERDSGFGGVGNEHDLQNRSMALYRVLKKDVKKWGDLIKRELHQDVYQIVLMLLKHGANPDEPIKFRSAHHNTASFIAARHPDPRLRNLLLDKKASTNQERHYLTTGPSRITSALKLPGSF